MKGFQLLVGQVVKICVGLLALATRNAAPRPRPRQRRKQVLFHMSQIFTTSEFILQNCFQKTFCVGDRKKSLQQAKQTLLRLKKNLFEFFIYLLFYDTNLFEIQIQWNFMNDIVMTWKSFRLFSKLESQAAFSPSTSFYTTESYIFIFGRPFFIQNVTNPAWHSNSIRAPQLPWKWPFFSFFLFFPLRCSFFTSLLHPPITSFSLSVPWRTSSPLCSRDLTGNLWEAALR